MTEAQEIIDHLLDEHGETVTSDPAEKREVAIGRELIELASLFPQGHRYQGIGEILKELGQELVDMHAVHEGRDDLAKVPIPASGKRYARMKGRLGTSPRKFELYQKMIADLTNNGATKSFKSKQVGQDPKLTRK